MKRLLCAAALLAGAASCGDDGGTPADPDAMEPDDPDAAPPDETFTTFVIDQIANQTADDTNAVPYADFATLDDPDAENPDAYDSLFP